MAAKRHAIPEKRERRAPRKRVRLDASIFAPSADAIPVIIHDLSADGFLAEFEEDLSVGSDVSLELIGPEPIPARVTWRSNWRYGCAFKTPLTPRELGEALAQNRVIWADFPNAGRDLGPPVNPSGGNAAASAPSEAPRRDAWPVAHRLGFLIGASSLLWGAIVVATHLPA